MFVFFNDTATTEIYTLSLHDALPIYSFNASTFAAREIASTRAHIYASIGGAIGALSGELHGGANVDRKSTRLNSSHANISYAVFCLKKKRPKSSESRVNVMGNVKLKK